MTQRSSILLRLGWLVMTVAAMTGASTWSAVGAEVGPAGYTNDFVVQPPAADWATVSRAGGGGDTYDFDVDVATITAATTTGLTAANGNTPAQQAGTASWSSNAFYLQTRPTGNRFTALMGKFVNRTGTNATEVRLGYLLTIAGGATTEDAGKGTRVYVSLTGEANSWTNLASLNNQSATAGSTSLATNLTVDWTNGGSLYLLWADDNNNGGTDVGNQIDDFSLTVTAGHLPISDLTLILDSPSAGSLFVSGADVLLSSTVLNGTAPHTVEYFTNTGPGNAAFTLAGSSTTPPFAVSLTAPPAGAYNVYARVTDNAGSPLTTNSVTNSFTIADPITALVASPENGAMVDNVTPVTAIVTVAGGTSPVSVQFYLDGVAKGTADTAPPFEMSFGALAVGDHLIYATVTDANGWRSNTLVHTVHVMGPLAVVLSPNHGVNFNFGQSLEVAAVGGGGTPPYSVAFYLNGALASLVTTPPFATNLGVLPVGRYDVAAWITDSATPVPQQVGSGTNTVNVVPNPVVVSVSNPTNGQSAVAGQALTLIASASVIPPLSVASVAFFLDGILVGTDSNAPFSMSVTSSVAGSHMAHAVAIDNLGRVGGSDTNLFTLSIDPLVNNSFANRITLTGAKVTTTGINVGATTETGEPTGGGGGGNNRGATLWWTWTAPVSGSVRIDTFGSSFNTVLGVYTGSAVNALTQVALNNNAPGFSDVSLVTFNAVQGTVYQIQVGGSAGFGGGNPATGSIQLNIQMPPTVAITSPAAGSTFLFGSNITVTATASSAAGSVTKVDLFRSGVLAGTATQAPYSVVVTDAGVGTNSLAAVVTDSIGQVVTSAVVNVLVANIGVTITSPNDGTVLTSTNPITVSAFTLLPSGTITNVEFLVDGAKFAEDGTAPFSGVWSNVVGGAHRLGAIGRDGAGNTYSALPVYIGVAQPLVPSNSVWKYLADGSDQGTAWIAPGFDDSSWTNGPAELGYGDGDEATTVPSGPAGALFITTYFRRAFNIGDTSALAGLSLSIEYDDAAAVYLNGVQVLRTANLPVGASYSTLATGNAVEDAVATVAVNLTNLVVGTNVFAVEIHQQAQDSSDISFNLQLLGLPAVVRNQFPLVAITNLTNGQTFLGASGIAIEADASDRDGTVAKVEFFANKVKLGEVTTPPYRFVWTDMPIGAHSLTAVATDDEGAPTTSAAVSIVAYDSAGTPVAAIVSPAHGAVMEGPTNLLLTATANALTGVTNVLFLANGVEIGSDDSAPYNAVWSSSFLSNGLQAVAFDANGVRGTSRVVTVTITIPPTNIVAPTIATQLPLGGASVTNLTNITVVFSERVQGVSASDLLLNGTPATRVTGSGSNYVFAFPQPPYGSVEIRWAAGHGITDFGFPADLPFNELGVDAEWFYTLLDRTPPTVVGRTPASNSTVTNLQTIGVVFSEPVTGVDASDLLVGGTPAFGVTGSGTTYTFNVSQPPSGTVSVTWAVDHGITDLADVPNLFNRTGNGATWNFTLDARTVLIQTNAVWRYVKGTNEASEPISAWRQPNFDVSAWGTGPAPFIFGEPAFTNALNPGTDVSEMATNGYSSIYLRREFVVNNAGAITNLILSHQSDDGFVAWLNGVEVFRYNVPSGELPYNGSASGSITESGANGGPPSIAATFSNVPSALVSGTNTLAIHAFNVISTPPSSDFVFNAQLYTFLSDAALVAPRIAQASPSPGDLLALNGVTIVFSEDVSGVDASDLLINGVPATSMTVSNSTTYSFSFSQPPYGPVVLSWVAGHGIQDLDTPAKPFDATAAGATLNYSLINPSNPRVLSQVPAAGSIVTGLTSVIVTFTEPVAGVEAVDLLVAGAPADSVSTADNLSFTFNFAQPAYGTVAIRWSTNHAIADLEVPANSFDPTRFGGQWNYSLVNPVPTVTLTSPTNGVFLQQPANIALRATATDNDGTIALVEFFQNSTKLGEATVAPYTLTWSNVTEGVYALQAVATDNLGLRATSAPVNVTVVTNLPIVLTRGPYLQIGSPTGGVVRWRTDIASDAVVRYGTDLFNLTNIAVQAFSTNEHIVPVTGLEPSTKYYYSIGSSSQRLIGGPALDGTNYWFKTSPVVGTRGPTRVWVLGDSGTAGNGSADRQISTRDAFYNFAATNGRPADLWLMLGDNAYNSGTDNEHQRAIFDIYPATLRNLFLWPTIGNHETSQSYTSTDFPYLHIFSLPDAGQAGGVPSGTEKYYSFDYANIHFVCLDSMTSTRSATSAMAQWLENDLETTDQEWVIVYFHHPPYTRGNHNSDAETDLIEVRQNLLPILEANGVDLVLSGHSHAWERSFLLHGHYGNSSTITESMKVDGGDGREGGTGAYRKNGRGEGVVYTVAGNAGQITGGQLNHPAHYLSLNELGTMVIDVTSNRLEATFVRENQLIRDRFTLIKPDFKPATPLNLTAVPFATDTIALSWNDTADNELGYIIERSLDGTNFVEHLFGAANSTNALDSGLLANSTYYYRVRATNGAALSDYSNIASASTTVPSGLPSAPVSLVARSDNGVQFYRTQMILSWQDRSTNEAVFSIERSLDGSTFVSVGTVAANINHYVDRNLESGTPYFYRVRAANLLGASLPSNLAGDVTHPQGQLAVEGATVAFHGGADGAAPVAYQWRFRDMPIFGETNETLVLNDVQITDEGEYTVAVTDANGRTVSNPAYLFVLSPPRIVLQPQNTTNAMGSSAMLSVEVSGSAPFSYNWRKNGALLIGAQGPTLTFTNVQPAQQAGYDVVIGNEFGSVTSRVAQLVVNLPPVAMADLVYRLADEDLAVEIEHLLANDGDPDGGIVALFSVATNTAHGASIQVSGRYVFYTPPAGYVGPDSFLYTITDVHGALASALVSVEISSNTPPQIIAVPDLITSVLTPVVITNLASDADIPANKLSFELMPASSANSNATVRAERNAFVWTPTREQAPSTNIFTVEVTDDGKPSLSSSRSFKVVVRDYVELTAGTAVVRAGDTTEMPMAVFSSAGLTELQFLVRYPQGKIQDMTVAPMAPQVKELIVQAAGPDLAQLTFRANATDPLRGAQQLARFSFVASPGQASAFLPFEMQNVTVRRATTGLAPSSLINAGRVTVVGGGSLLEARQSGNGARDLILYGPLGVHYFIESTTNYGPDAVWLPWRDLTTTNLSNLVPITDPPVPFILFRTRE